MDFPKLKGKALLSPMAGVTDVAFRALAKRYGAALTYTEFVNSIAITRENEKTLEMLQTDPSERPVAVQLFGSSIKEVVEAAKMIEDRFDIIDVNCGCPAWKVIKTGAGSELLKKPEGIADFISKLSSAVNSPVTLKIRSGIDERSINAVEIAKKAEDAGAAAIAIHGRTQKQGYTGKSDWNIIKKVKESVNIPVIGNGDVFSPEDFKERLELSRVDYIMVARGAMGNPFIFQQIDDFLKKGEYEKRSGMDLFREYALLAEKYKISYSQLKNHAMNFTRGIKDAAKLRLKLSQCRTTEEIIKVMS
ncbi:tRNA dihydrouridine synthase DusB [Candidatus Woesearchaeota archaeon]|nr:tRNA dihydrouridine synthase DusB [Candidatus Woesearchaeota archaeon]